MRAMLGGPYLLSEIGLKVNELVENLEANGVEDINYLNVYFVPRVGGRTKRFYNADHKEIDTLRFDEIELTPFVPLTEKVTPESSDD